MVEKVMQDIKLLHRDVTELVIVSNNVFEDGICYDASTMEYLAALGRINERLASQADEVIEVVVGIPLVCSTRKE